MKPSPEERLLSLIRGKPAPAVARASAPAGGEAAVVAPVRGAASGSPRLRWPTVLAWGLGAALAVEGVSLVVLLLRPLPEVRVPAVPEVSPPPAEVPPLADMPSLAASAARPLFQSAAAGASAPGVSPTAGAGPSDVAKALASRLTLMGIVSGEPPQVVIEDAETKKTYFVTIGQAVVEGAVVEQVLENRVILDLGGEKIDLSL